MSMQTSPRQAASATPHLPDGEGERFTGFGVMAVPFASGHVLALRVWARTTIGAPYRSVWHRDPSGSWHMYVTAAPERSCPRYFSAAASFERVAGIDVEWSDAAALRVRIPSVLDWTVHLEATPATKAMSAIAQMIPANAKRSDAVLGAMGPMSRPVLRTGRMRMVGAAPNRQRFQVVPERVWRVAASAATIEGASLGTTHPLDRQTRLGDFWMPQRGVFYVGDARFEAFDPTRHDAPRVATA
ncbi:hypothetical protein [Microbacterium candidum]|uniref:Uncharacterized protein n=1 Tax=Microbacterium candidum TaxID=3041922 RepID=A0ABT7MTI5_9MICO|nr:hypothetical protein [Microbacterium sp. ASV49]MDL9977756.1 hypothetical protein [Microbacterium sp. ASV49]